MEIAEIIGRIERVTGKFERAAVEAAIARREEVIPELLHILEEIANPDRAYQLDIEGDYMAHLYAMFLLAQFREARAYPLVLRIALLPGDLLDSLFGDFITGNMGNVLASVCGGDLEGIQSIIENENADEWVRGAALGGLVTLVAAGVRSREELVTYFASLFRGRLTDKNEIVWSDLVAYSTDLYAEELIGDIERAYDQGLVDPMMIGMDDVRRDLAKGEDWALARLAASPHHRLVDDTVKAMEWWDCFQEKKPRKTEEKTQTVDTDNSWWRDAMVPFKRTGPKIGRNDPCSCGSGKKYKKCCGQ